MTDSKVRITEWHCPFLGRVVSHEHDDGTSDTIFELPARVSEAVATASLTYDIGAEPRSFMQDLVLDYIASGAEDQFVNGYGLTPEERCLRLLKRWCERQPQVTVN